MTRPLQTIAALLFTCTLLLTSGCFIRPTGYPPTQVTVSTPAPTQVVTATPMASPGAVANGMISYPHQRIRYPLSISYPRVVTIYVDGQGLDPTVAIYDGYGNRIAFNDDGGSNLDSQLSTMLNPGSYVVEVAGYSTSTGPFTMTVN